MKAKITRGTEVIELEGTPDEIRQVLQPQPLFVPVPYTPIVYPQPAEPLPSPIWIGPDTKFTVPDVKFTLTSTACRPGVLGNQAD